MNEISPLAILEWLKEENCIFIEENVYYAEKAFFANSVVRWCIKERKAKKLTRTEIDNHIRFLVLFLKGKLDLWWEDGIIKVRTIKKGDSSDCNNVETENGEQE